MTVYGHCSLSCCWVALERVWTILLALTLEEDLGEGGNLYTLATMSGIGNKRTAGEPGPSAPPEKKAGVEDSGTTVETIKLGGVSSTEELDIRTLQSKNRKLAEMLDQRQAIEDELREHIEKLERRQATDDASLLIINRYWNQVGNSFCSFVRAVSLSLLYHCAFCSRAFFVLSCLACPVIQFDENIRIILKRFDLDQGLGDLLSERKALVVPEPEPDSDSNQERKDERERGEGLEPAFSFLATLASSTSEEIESQLQERVESSRRAVAQIVTMYDKLQEKVDVLSHKLNSGDISLMEEAVVELNSYLSHENGRLQELADVLQEKHRIMSQEFSKLQERVETAESRVSVLETMIDDLQWDIDKIRKREQRLNRHLADVLERVNSKGYKVYGAGSSLYGGTITINARKFEEMNAELEENKELAGNRLNELEELRQDLEEVTTQNEKLKIIVVYSKSMAANEQAGPINREMRHLISSLQNHNHQLKGEVLRYKRKLREAQSDLSKIRSRSGSALLQSQSSTEDTKEEPPEIKQEPDDPSAQVSVPKAASEDANEMKARRDEEERERERREREREREKEKEKERAVRGLPWLGARCPLSHSITPFPNGTGERIARLTCPCCNMRKKDAVLTKCFHVFCFECVKTRYDTRQRKCPKCNAAFGANDFHRIYIG
ncbi:LOW QUALITY PROTEIN: E3 ubiquitin-protein ligase BRE1A-like [Cyanocitta cristata]